MVKIEMLESAAGSQNGVNVQYFEKSKSYIICERLANVFWKTGKAKFIKEENKEISLENAVEQIENETSEELEEKSFEDVISELEEKSMETAPENKMAKPVKENKKTNKKKKIR